MNLDDDDNDEESKHGDAFPKLENNIRCKSLSESAKKNLEFNKKVQGREDSKFLKLTLFDVHNVQLTQKIKEVKFK